MLLQRLDVIERTPALSAAHHGRLEVASAQVERAANARLQARGRRRRRGSRAMVVALSHALMHWMIGRLSPPSLDGWPIWSMPRSRGSPVAA